MQRPTTPSITVGDTTQDTPQTQASSHSNAINAGRPSSRTSGGSNPIDEPWTRPSIRIRRLPSNQSIQRTRAATVTGSNHGGRQRAASNAEYRGVQHSSAAAGRGGASTNTGTNVQPAEASPSPTTRPRHGSGNSRNLRHENRSLVVPENDGGRRRSSSDPQRMRWDALPGARDGQRIAPQMSPLEEGTVAATAQQRPPNRVLPFDEEGDEQNPNTWRRMSGAAGRTYSRFLPTLSTTNTAEADADDHLEADMVDVLDTIDPEVSTLNTLTNVQNSLFVPDLGRLLNRRPTYNLTRHVPGTEHTKAIEEEPETVAAVEAIVEGEEAGGDLGVRPERTNTLISMTSRLDDSHFAVLPHGERLAGWTAEDRAELDDHVRHLLHSRKEKFKRGWKGFRQYVSKPLGFFVALYAFLITVFGLAWVLFLIGWISVGGRKDYITNIIDNILVALFAIMGDGLAPFRAIDTYHMCFIAHYHHLTWRLRREQSLPKLKNHNDLPGLGPSWDQQQDVEADAEEKQMEYSVLKPNQQKRLVHHQKKFNRSHTFYKPHETNTHHAFPLRLLVAVVVLLDCHSCLQIALGTCTWAISYHVRPFALTTVILCCSITCNITAGVLISVGDHKTRKKDVLERMFRQQITSQAIHQLEKRKEKERQSMDISRELSVAGPVNEKAEDTFGSVLPTPSVEDKNMSRFVTAQEAQSQIEIQPVETSTKTTTTIAGPSTTTTTMNAG